MQIFTSILEKTNLAWFNFKIRVIILQMSDQSYYSESFLTEQSEIPGAQLIGQRAKKLTFI